MRTLASRLLLALLLLSGVAAQYDYLSANRVNFAGATLGTKMYFGGGSSADVDVYDFSTGLWIYTVGQLSLARTELAAGAAGSKVLFAGGVA